MTTLAATPAQIGAAFARMFVRERTDPCFEGYRHPMDLGSKELWMLACYSNHPEFWKMAMVQLMGRARAETDQATRMMRWYEIGQYLLDQASPSELQDEVLKHFLVTLNADLPWTMDKIHRLRRHLRWLDRQQQQQSIAA